MQQGCSAEIEPCVTRAYNPNLTWEQRSLGRKASCICDGGSVLRLTVLFDVFNEAYCGKERMLLTALRTKPAPVGYTY